MGESKEAEGSTFFFKLPLNIDTEYKRAMPVSYEIKKTELIPGISDLKVLIAEDDEASVMILSLKLENSVRKS